MFKILKQPYPFSEKSPKQILIQSILEGAFIAIFLIIIEPFGISNWEIPNKSLHLIVYGLMTSACVFTLRFFVFKKFDKYSDQANWTILREIVSIFTLILLITTGNYFLTFLLFKTTLNIFSFSNMLFMVATIGVFPILFGVMLNYIYQLKKYNKPIDITHTFTKDAQMTT